MDIESSNDGSSHHSTKFKNNIVFACTQLLVPAWKGLYTHPPPKKVLLLQTWSFKHLISVLIWTWSVRALTWHGLQKKKNSSVFRCMKKSCWYFGYDLKTGIFVLNRGANINFTFFLCRYTKMAKEWTQKYAMWWDRLERWWKCGCWFKLKILGFCFTFSLYYYYFFCFSFVSIFLFG